MQVLKDTRKLALMGVMLALTVLLDATPMGAIPIGSVSATIIHIPTIVTGVILGPAAGFLMGTFMGIISLVHAATRPVTPIDPLFINPLLSVFPRMFIGVAAHYTYAGLSRVLGRARGAKSAAAFGAGVAGSLTNTILVLGMLYLVKVREVLELLGMQQSDLVKMLLAIVTTNGILEAVVAGILTSAVSLAYFSYNRSR
ncbi:ECF transporter S component [Anaerotalea alkaliphila]|uniref:ECF transporter S component n=1 Tax=Anaerotalea alkaliphila TaxID=2662126 RepID=A0A7X5HV75_9FIRM|nr:ECF transporter S component [Anaerotalea alkaliphila]NDL67209.1 ECF transporter S component [Anaerotalea alkaliphila]